MPLHLIFGPMFSGKSTELLRRVRVFMASKKMIVSITCKRDTRYNHDARISTHDRDANTIVQLPHVPIDDCHKLDWSHLCNLYDVFAIDEAQFLEGVVPFCEYLLQSDKIVIVAALDGTFERKPFGSILDLVPFARSVVKLNAVCMNCHENEAPYTHRLSAEKAVEVIGGADKYESLCEKCFYEKTDQK